MNVEALDGDEWFYTDSNNQPLGPVGRSELKELAAVGSITPATYVLKKGEEEWQFYGDFLKASLPAIPPPLPAMTAHTGKMTEPSANLPIWGIWLIIIGALFTAPPVAIIIALLNKQIVGGQKIAVCILGALFSIGFLISMVSGESKPTSTVASPVPPSSLISAETRNSPPTLSTPSPTPRKKPLDSLLHNFAQPSIVP